MPLVLLFSRLSAPIHLLRLAVASLETDSAKKIAETPFAFAIDLVVDEATRASMWLARDMRANSAADICIGVKRFHDLAHGLATEIDMSEETRWAKRLSHLRADTAALLRSKLDGLPGQVRRLLRPRPKEEIAPGAVVDIHAVADVEASLEILRTCRLYAAEVAVSEITLRLGSELETCLDTATRALLDFGPQLLARGPSLPALAIGRRGPLFEQDIRPALCGAAGQGRRSRDPQRTPCGARLIAAPSRLRRSRFC